MELLKTKEFDVGKIETCSNGWLLHPKDEKNQKVFIDKRWYDGKMPPFHRWFWKKLRVKTKGYDDFIISAYLNGVKLFEIPKKDFPPEVAEKFAREEELNDWYRQKLEQEDEHLKSALQSYLSSMEAEPQLEEKILKLPVCWRVFLLQHLYRGNQTKEGRCRLSLMYNLAKIANKIYRRFVEKPIFAQLRFLPPVFDYHDNLDVIEKVLDDDNERYVVYRMAKELMRETLPPVADRRLNYYLVWLILQMLSCYAGDYAKLSSRRLTGIFSGKELLSDEEEYKRQSANFTLHHLNSFILPDVFSDEDFKKFVRTYSLK